MGCEIRAEEGENSSIFFLFAERGACSCVTTANLFLFLLSSTTSKTF